MHVGKNVARLRMFKGIKQGEVARELKMTQQNYSHIENSEVIEDHVLEKISAIIGYDVEDIKTLPEAPWIHSSNQQGGNVVNYQLSSIEHIKELYERILAEEKTKNQHLQDKIDQLKEEISELRKQFNRL